MLLLSFVSRAGILKKEISRLTFTDLSLTQSHKGSKVKGDLTSLTTKTKA